MKKIPYILLSLIFSVNTYAEIITLSSNNEDKTISIINKTFAYEIEEAKSLPTKIELEIEVAQIDLNNDNKNEIVARFLHPYFCGRYGCKTVIIERKDDGWNLILSNPTSESDIEAQNEIFNGYHVLTFFNGNNWKYKTSRYERQKP